jgi:hypothetical protein
MSRHTYGPVLRRIWLVMAASLVSALLASADPPMAAEITARCAWPQQ